MQKRIGGITPVMLTPFDDAGAVDFDSLERLVEWYVERGADTLFAVCQSSEMQYLSLSERVEISRFVAARAGGRIPVIASGHVSDDAQDQARELELMAGTGADALVLVTNRLDLNNDGSEAFRSALEALLAHLPADMPLGLYECPAPYRRLLSDDELKFCRDTGRFVVFKDVSCDLDTVKRRVALCEGSPLAIVNANAAIAREAMRAGSEGFAGVFTNFHPDLYAWVYRNRLSDSPLMRDLTVFLALAAMAEPMGYPALAKFYHTRLGTLRTMKCRTIDFDIRERFWALEPLLDHIMEGTEIFRQRIAEET